MDRRKALAGIGGAALGLGLITVKRDGVLLTLSPADAHSADHSYRTLTAEDVTILEAFGETLLPGAKAAGIAHFVDHHISVPPAESLLMLRYLDVPPPYADFYRAGLAALDRHAHATAGKGFAALDTGEATALVGSIAAAPPADWQGPPSPLVYFAIRADAVDVVYGTMAGFEALDIPYMAHIEPPTPW